MEEGPIVPGIEEAKGERPFDRKPVCYFDEDVPRLVSVQTWKSGKARPRESITLMTQLSEDRLSMLENQCRTRFCF